LLGVVVPRRDEKAIRVPADGVEDVTGNLDATRALEP